MQYLPFVESSYNPKAYSKMGAAGIWQIMPSTARVLGLELNATVDERLDPEAASWAAARYLKDSRKTLTIAARAKNAGISDYELGPVCHHFVQLRYQRHATRHQQDGSQIL
ncbi:MAG: hypothetical protein Ct9H300mP16_16030 [Pseudomonadota bacterium]|nr:MAG: hypothetical protein Ct9H300mP16_16030 [Pseudomonadota bacterium]